MKKLQLLSFSSPREMINGLCSLDRMVDFITFVNNSTENGIYTWVLETTRAKFGADM